MVVFNYVLFAFIWLAPYLTWELIFPSSVDKRPVSFWWPRLILLIALQASLNIPFLMFFVTPHFFQKVDLAYLNGLRGFWGQCSPVVYGISAFLFFTFVHYWSHVARHRVSFFFRWFHEMHHSARRFETFTSMYAHPFELLFLKSSFCFPLLFAGFSAQAILNLMFMYFIVNGWTHMNIKTPSWLALFVIRPEQHAHHHSVHDHNFGIIPLWDFIFGTLRNPEEHPSQVGFGSDYNVGFWGLLLGRSIKTIDPDHFDQAS
jgi:sterol desaturase/sphingolipid hydroxylase (fatty acid hydroxylase superfamily)